MVTQTLSGNIVDVVAGEIFPGHVHVEGTRIGAVERDASVVSDRWIMPGLVNAHVHVESSKMSPHAFGIALTRNGILATVSDPHEIANVCGVPGMEWMLENGRDSPIETMFGVPACVPATNGTLETNGAHFNLETVTSLLDTGRYPYLAEVMNYPAVIAGDPELIGMVRGALERGLPADGHAPGVTGQALATYRRSGISTDHECVTLAEAREKAALGLHILIREGSAAKNFEALAPILAESPDQVMFCTDDSEPHELATGQIDAHVRRALAEGYDPMAVLRAATRNPIRHYRLGLGMLQPGDSADWIVVRDLMAFEVEAAYRKGVPLRAEDLPFVSPPPINRFHALPIDAERLRVAATDGAHRVRVIGATPGQLVTQGREERLLATGGALRPDPERDIIKIVALNRYEAHAKPQVAFVSGLGLQRGAIASTVAHDSHNIVAAGIHDHEIAEAIRLVVAAQGGQSLVDGNRTFVEPLEVGGLMSVRSPDAIIAGFSHLEEEAKKLGDNLASPFMALSFLCLLVIPALKLSDKVGLFDVEAFQPVSLFV